jgi:hypothetical protein
MNTEVAKAVTFQERVFNEIKVKIGDLMLVQNLRDKGVPV